MIGLSRHLIRDELELRGAGGANSSWGRARRLPLQQYTLRLSAPTCKAMLCTQAPGCLLPASRLCSPTTLWAPHPKHKSRCIDNMHGFFGETVTLRTLQASPGSKFWWGTKHPFELGSEPFSEDIHPGGHTHPASWDLFPPGRFAQFCPPVSPCLWCTLLIDWHI